MFAFIKINNRWEYESVDSAEKCISETGGFINGKEILVFNASLEDFAERMGVNVEDIKKITPNQE